MRQTQMKELLATIATAPKSELYNITNEIKRYATSRDISQDDLKQAVDIIIAIDKRLEPYNRISIDATYRAYGVKNY
jgi:hypothetical protein